MRAGMRGRPTRVIFLTVFLTAAALTTRGKFSVAGDEPHYLIIDESIVSDGDLDLRNNYAESDGKWFGHESLIDDAHTRVTPWGAAWSKHDIGLPLLMRPVYAAATRAASHAPEEVLKRFRMSRGLFAYSLMGLSLITAVAYGCTRLFEALRDVAARADAPAPVAMTVTLAMALTPPVLSHAFLVFPETVAFVVVCLVLRAAWSAADDLRPRHVAGLALALGLTPWLHRKFSFFVAGLAVALVMSKPAWFARQRSGVKGLFAALFLFPQIALHAWTFAVWGSVGGPQMMDDPRFSVSAFNTGVFGLWLDREYGLAAYSPIYLLAIPAILLAPARLRWWFAPLLLLYLPMAAFTEWWAGFSPAARYVMPLAPIIAVLAVGAFRTRTFRIAGLATLGLQAIFWVATVPRPRDLWPRMRGVNAPIARVPVLGPLYESLLPSLVKSPEWARVALCLVVLAVVSAALLACASLEDRRAAAR
jgi:hypothetical protein